MAKKITDADIANKGVIGLDDVPGLTATQMQKKFEELETDVIIPKVNEIIDDVGAINGSLANFTKKIVKQWSPNATIKTTTNSGGLALIIRNNGIHILYSAGSAIVASTVYQGTETITFNISGLSLVAQTENGKNTLWGVLPIIGEWTLE